MKKAWYRTVRKRRRTQKLHSHKPSDKRRQLAAHVGLMNKHKNKSKALYKLRPLTIRYTLYITIQQTPQDHYRIKTNGRRFWHFYYLILWKQEKTPLETRTNNDEKHQSRNLGMSRNWGQSTFTLRYAIALSRYSPLPIPTPHVERGY